MIRLDRCCDQGKQRVKENLFGEIKKTAQISILSLFHFHFHGYYGLVPKLTLSPLALCRIMEIVHSQKA